MLLSRAEDLGFNLAQRNDAESNESEIQISNHFISKNTLFSGKSSWVCMH